ncbi:MAG: FecR family protein [Candidatus Pseudobacter hemicellulosilyticus]|uniref:FecR family protein n=1 Tax=Candidatus Pseudobacter hemicellulosilyticus TaxID=3121375 RepID=A0AAJ6BFD6_9BACT|nr:MAG: FecR family protein [Pseudobacter sp.]
MANNIEAEFYDLLGLKMAGISSPEQLARLDHILSEHEAFFSLYKHLETAGAACDYPSEILEQAYASHYVKKKLLALPVKNNEAPPPRQHKTRYKKYLAIAAVSLLVLATVFYFSFPKNQPSVTDHCKNEITTEKGSKSKVMLPDSTLVVLNADSHLTYDNTFNKHNREVVLTGEAYFEVKYNKDKPFIIHTDKTAIKVLGTEFNVRNYPKEDLMETSLIKGKIELTFDDKNNNRVVMNPSEKLVISKSGLSKTNKDKPRIGEEDIFKLKRITVKDSTIAELAWLHNELCFVDKTLDLIASELEREFKTTILFRNEAVKSYRYTLHSDNNNLDEIMHIIKLSQNINYRFKSKDTLIIE